MKVYCLSCGAVIVGFPVEDRVIDCPQCSTRHVWQGEGDWGQKLQLAMDSSRVTNAVEAFLYLDADIRARLEGVRTWLGLIGTLISDLTAFNTGGVPDEVQFANKDNNPAEPRFACLWHRVGSQEKSEFTIYNGEGVVTDSGTKAELPGMMKGTVIWKREATGASQKATT